MTIKKTKVEPKGAFDLPNNVTTVSTPNEKETNGSESNDNVKQTRENKILRQLPSKNQAVLDDSVCDIENLSNISPEVLNQAKKIEKSIRVVELLYFLSFAVLGGFICYNLYDTYASSESGTTFYKHLFDALLFPQVFLGPSNVLQQIQDPTLCTWAPNYRETENMWLEIQSRYQGISNETSTINTTGFKNCTTLSLYGRSTYKRLSEDIIAGRSYHRLTIYIGSKKSDKYNNLLNAQGPTHLTFGPGGRVQANARKPVSHNGGNNGSMPSINPNLNSGYTNYDKSSSSGSKIEERQPKSVSNTAPNASAPSASNSSKGYEVQPPSPPKSGQGNQSSTPPSAPPSTAPNAPAPSGSNSSKGYEVQSPSPPRSGQGNQTNHQNGRKLLATSDTDSTTANTKFVEEPWSSTEMIMYIVPRHVGLITDTARFDDMTSQNNIAISGAINSHTHIQLLKREQHFLTGQIYDSYTVHSSAVKIALGYQVEDYRKYLVKQQEFTVDDWTTILGFDVTSELLDEIQLMINAKLRIANGTDALFSLNFQSMKVDQLVQTPKMSWEELVGNIGGWFGIFWGASLHLILFHRGNGLIMHFLSIILATADIGGKWIITNPTGLARQATQRRNSIQEALLLNRRRSSLKFH